VGQGAAEPVGGGTLGRVIFVLAKTATKTRESDMATLSGMQLFNAILVFGSQQQAVSLGENKGSQETRSLSTDLTL